MKSKRITRSKKKCDHKAHVHVREEVWSDLTSQAKSSVSEGFVTIIIFPSPLQIFPRTTSRPTWFPKHFED